MTGLEFPITFALGIIVGLMFRGVNINTTHKQEDKPVDSEYNQSYGDPNVKQYLDQHYNVGDK